jgi:hypothetical protein
VVGVRVSWECVWGVVVANSTSHNTDDDHQFFVKSTTTDDDHQFLQGITTETIWTPLDILQGITTATISSPIKQFHRSFCYFVMFQNIAKYDQSTRRFI